MEGFNYFIELSVWDWGVIFLIVTSTTVSIFRGFSREAISLAGWVIAFVVANLYANNFAKSFSYLIDNSMARLIVSWLVLFLVVLFSATISSKIFSKILSVAGLGLLDRILGTVFGFSRGIIIAMVLVFLGREVSPPLFKEVVSRSDIIDSLEILVDWSLELLGSNISDILPEQK